MRVERIGSQKNGYARINARQSVERGIEFCEIDLSPGEILFIRSAGDIKRRPGFSITAIHADVMVQYRR